MTPKQAPPPPGITLDDVFYILRRYKWLTIVLAVVVLTAVFLVRQYWPVPYASEAMLMIKYVHENKPPEKIGVDTSIMGDVHGEMVINSELKILASFDLASNVVEALGPAGTAKILAKSAGGTNNKNLAANVIRSGFLPSADKSDVIELKFTDPDPEMVQPVLSLLIAAYLQKHREVHQPEYLTFLQKQKDDIEERINTIDKELEEVKQKANIDSTVNDSEKASGDMRTRILSEELEAQAELAGDKATIDQMQKMVPPAPGPVSTNSSGSNAVAAVPPDKVAEYQRLYQQWNDSQTKGQELRRTYQPGNSLVKENQAQTAVLETDKNKMEKDFPGLTAMKPAETKGAAASSSPQTADPRVALNMEITKANALAAKIQILANQLAVAQTNSTLMTGLEGRISQLQRNKEIASAEFAFYSTRLEEEAVNEKLGNSNISLVESPTPPAKDIKKFNKALLGGLGGGLALAFGLPFLLGLVLDRSLKRPLEVQTKLGLPFFISIPRLNGKGNGRLKGLKIRALLPDKSKGKDAAAEPAAEGALQANGHAPAPEHRLALEPYYETLRDRLITYFEMSGLTHKPKLVALTSCGRGAGVTSTAAGLAASLSETGEGNVLLVNMNARDGAAHHFYKGDLACGLEEVFEKGARQNALVQDKLYVAKEMPEDERLPRILPKRFSHLLPIMKASDFDYIIFDMPPVSQISITPRLARFMDMILLVVESEKTDRDAATRAAAVLSESKASVGVVLNKSRTFSRSKQHDI